MATHAIRLARKLWVVLLTVSLPSCAGSLHPISSLDRSKPDERLFGAWKASLSESFVDPERKGNGKHEFFFAFIGRSAYRDAPAGLMTAVTIENRPNHQLNVDRGCEFFTTWLDGETYANFVDDEPAPHEGDPPSWARVHFKRYLFAKYAVERDRLTIWLADSRAVEAAIRRGDLKGKITDSHGLFKFKEVLITATSEELSRFLRRGGSTSLFPDFRVEPGGKILGTRLVFYRVR